jgi:hypothetical protein
VLIPPGRYLVLSRFAPANIKVEELWDEPRLFTFPLNLGPGGECTIGNGPASMVIQAESQPLLQWSGNSRTTKEGVEFFGEDLLIQLEFPHEWLPTAGRHYVLRLIGTALGAPVDTEVVLDEGGRTTVSIRDVAAKAGWKPGVARLVAEVRRPAEARVQLRGSVLYWHGLIRISEGLRFECTAIPQNIELKLSDNAQVAHLAIKPVDSASRTMRLAFTIAEDRRQSFTWNLPGIYVEVDGQSEGLTGRVNRPLGSVEAVSYTSSKQIIVTASEPGSLKLGDWQQHVDFARRPSKVLPASFLASRITANGRRLFYVSENGVEHELLHLVQPHEVLRISSAVRAGQFEVQFELTKELDALQIHGDEVLYGDSLELVVRANESEWTPHSKGRARLFTGHSSNGTYQATVYIDLIDMPLGAWVFRFDAAVGGVWGHLENARQDWFGAGLLLGPNGIQQRVHDLTSNVASFDDAQSLAVLGRVQKALLPCYAQQAWESLSWLDDAWDELVRRWRTKEENVICTLVELACLRAPEDCATSWLLQRTVSASFPRMFALSGVRYAGMADKDHCLPRTLVAIAHSHETYPNVFPHLYHEAAASGFSNLAAIMRGEPPRNFRVANYTEALRQLDLPEYGYRIEDEQYAPSAGDYLGPVHYRYAMRALELGYDRTVGGNEFRRGQAIALCRWVNRHFFTFNDDGCAQLQGQSPRVSPWPCDEELEAEAAQRVENLEGIAHFLSCMAYYCRAEARHPGKLNGFLQKSNAAIGTLESSLVYVLQIGEALFGYYLLLWDLVLSSEWTRVAER